MWSVSLGAGLGTMPTSSARYLVLTLAAAGCATLELTPQGKQVQLLSAPPSDLLTEYSELETLACSRGQWNVRKAETNVIQCQHELRNRTAALGGDLFVITSQQIGNDECARCVTLVGTAYARSKT